MIINLYVWVGPARGFAKSTTNVPVDLLSGAGPGTECMTHRVYAFQNISMTFVVLNLAPDSQTFHTTRCQSIVLRAVQRPYNISTIVIAASAVPIIFVSPGKRALPSKRPAVNTFDESTQGVQM